MSDDSHKTPAVVTVKELALRLGVTERSVRRWIQAGKLPKCSSLGHCSFWSTDQLRPFLDVRGDA